MNLSLVQVGRKLLLLITKNGTTAATELAYRWASKVPDIEISSSDPAADETDVPVDKTINVVFSLGMNATTLTSSNITLTPGPVETTISLGTDGKTVSVNPNSNLSNNTQYTVTVTTNVRGLYGPWTVPFPAQDTFSFTTVE